MTAGTPITDIERRQVVDWLISNGKTPEDVSRGDIARQFGYTDRRARTIRDELILTWDKWTQGCAADAPEEDRPPRDDREYSGNRLIVNIDGIPFNDPESLIDHLGMDRLIWRLERFKFKAYQGFAAQKAQSKVMKRPVKNGGGEYIAWVRPEKTEIVKADLYSVTATFERLPDVAATLALVDSMQERAESYAPVYPALIFRDLKQTGNMAEISVYDHHFQALIWGKETGWEDWDTPLADKEFRNAVETMLTRAKGFGLDSIMFSLGNDLQNADNRAGTTEAGTPQFNDSRYEKVCEAVQRSAVWAIEACREVVPKVIVPMVRGNHDPLTTFHLGGFLKAWFRNCPEIEIDNSPLQRKAYQHGKVMLMLTHGKGIKTDKYPLLMATEYPQMWADTLWRETHAGHIHTRQGMRPDLDEVMGVAVRRMPSLRPPCSWGSDNGYVGNIRSAETLIWNNSEGLIGSAVYSVLSKRAA
jgi:hypothetical protein